MAFIEIKPMRGRAKTNRNNSVCVAFVKLNTGSYCINIFIGTNLADQMQLHYDGRVQIFHEDQNPRVILLKKSATNGFKLREVKRSTGESLNVLKVQLVWKKFIPDDIEKRLHEVRHVFADGGLKFFLDRK